jgi:vesicle-fusing ATPase
MGTTSQRSVLKQLDLQAIFNRELAVPNVSSHKELVCIVNRSMIMNDWGYVHEFCSGHVLDGSELVNPA